MNLTVCTCHTLVCNITKKLGVNYTSRIYYYTVRMLLQHIASCVNGAGVHSLCIEVTFIPTCVMIV